MPRDPRPFITVHDGMPEHPKIEALSDGAFRLLVTTWCWCNRTRTDGRVKAASWAKRGTARARRELIEAGLAEETDDGVQMHDYLEHQRSAAEIDELSQKRAEAGKRGGNASAKVRASAKAIASPGRQQTPSKIQPEQEVEEEQEKRRELLRSSQRAHETFGDFWDAYPRRTAKPDAERAWLKATKRADPEIIIAAAKRYRNDPNREDAYTAHPSTWLNRDGWNDPPLPVRNVANGRPVPSNIDPVTGKVKGPGWEFGM